MRQQARCHQLHRSRALVSKIREWKNRWQPSTSVSIYSADGAWCRVHRGQALTGRTPENKLFVNKAPGEEQRTAKNRNSPHPRSLAVHRAGHRVRINRRCHSKQKKHDNDSDATKTIVWNPDSNVDCSQPHSSGRDRQFSTKSSKKKSPLSPLTTQGCSCCHKNQYFHLPHKTQPPDLTYKTPYGSYDQFAKFPNSDHRTLPNSLPVECCSFVVWIQVGG